MRPTGGGPQDVVGGTLPTLAWCYFQRVQHGLISGTGDEGHSGGSVVGAPEDAGFWPHNAVHDRQPSGTDACLGPKPGRDGEWWPKWEGRHRVGGRCRKLRHRCGIGDNRVVAQIAARRQQHIKGRITMAYHEQRRLAEVCLRGFGQGNISVSGRDFGGGSRNALPPAPTFAQQPGTVAVPGGGGPGGLDRCVELIGRHFAGHLWGHGHGHGHRHGANIVASRVMAASTRPGSVPRTTRLVPWAPFCVKG